MCLCLCVPHTHTQTLYWAVSATAMPYQMRSDQAVIYKAGKREFAGGRKEESVEEGEGRILPSSWTACFHSCYPARPPEWKKKEKKKGRPRLSSKHFLLSSLWLSLSRPHLQMFLPKSCCRLQLWGGERLSTESRDEQSC